MKKLNRISYSLLTELHDTIAMLNDKYNSLQEAIPYIGTRKECLDMIKKAFGCKRIICSHEEYCPSGMVDSIMFENNRRDYLLVQFRLNGAQMMIFSEEPDVAERYFGVFKKIHDMVDALYGEKMPIPAWCYISPDVSSSSIAVTLNLMRDYDKYIPFSNYVPSVSEPLLEMEKRLENGNHSGRIILLEGPPGTGKSYYIRRMVCRLFQKKKYEDVHYFLGDGIRHLNLEHCLARNILVFEDADDILSGSRGLDTAYSKILNLSSGFLDIKALFVFTSNLPITNVDKAFTRDGRLLARTHFDLFSTRQAEQWFTSKGETRNLKDERYSLAELYSILNGTSKIQNTNASSIGFQAA